VNAEWNEEKGRWIVRLESGVEKRQYEEEADVVIQATGSLNAWKWPALDGLHDFKGTLMHSAQWDSSSKLEGKRVALIGSGSTSIQILPRIAAKVKSIDQYVRSATWLGFPFLGEELDARKDAIGGNFTYTESEKESLAKDSHQSMQYRKHLMKKLNQLHQVTQLNSEMQADALVAMKQSMKEKLVNKEEIANFLTPTFAVGCRRLTPGPGYLESFQRDNVKMIMKGIKSANQAGLVDDDGQAREYDVIICATGFDTSYAPRYPIIGQDNQSLRDRWAKFPMSYMSTCVDGFPNLFMINGPNSAVGSGDLVVLFQTEVDYAIKCCQKLRSQAYKSMQPKREAVEEFQQYSQTYFRQTVFGTKCRTWYKAGNSDGPIYALWPGSCLHAVRTLTDPRWEDFNFTKASTNRFDYLGNGTTVEETLEDGVCNQDTAWYVTEPNSLLASIGQVDGARVLNIINAASST
jgi:cation diffusion facilitator CzcD-associated flavoprotein CzcO